MNQKTALPRMPLGSPSLALFGAAASPGKRDLLFTVPSLALALVFVLRMARHLPLLPITTGDSAAYLQMAGYRPPIYGWLANCWIFLTGGLEGLPLAQLVVLGCAIAVFATEFGRLLRSPLVSILAIPLILLQTAVYDSSRWLLTESVFISLTLIGLAMLCRHARRGDLAPLLVAAACFGMSTLLRSTGMAFLPLPLLVAVFDRRFPLWPALQRAAIAGVIAVSVLLSGMGWTYVRHGHFEIGSWAGISLLGKALVLLRPEDAVGKPSAVQAVLPAAAEARRLMAEQPDIAARLRAQVQSSGDVRFPAFWPTAAREWPEWIAADGRGKDLLARAIARDLISAHPGEYLQLWAHDWLSLIIQPAYWPAWATTVPADRNAFAFCREMNNCWGLERYDLPLHGQVLLIGAAVGGAVLGLVLIPLLAWPVIRRRASPDMALIWGTAIVLHGSLLVTSAVEAGHVRYTVALHVLDIVMLLWLLVRLLPGPMRLGSARTEESLP
ncbi:hypothetical protein QWZ14_15785 [Paeniroseomonas aquatica]|uniref:Glycosyltransferase RgtA/B/C/D-like domain-containing protein n=1 Tax=Paeniroseomonas aquatica TaxID=373043 RepID=A0ABT8A7Z0_9PROT|nr:hypothetical protein [Paeniroseomonas aquatica]MDN3565830.1 hypothetical protein [Paeniroseomonas aquatica]